MLIRQLEYFVALARERHFGRAAAACYVSQPALSDALRRLETELDVPLIRRGRSFEGLTPEGERLVGWARRILADHGGMLAEAQTLRAGLTGHLRIGVVPSASTTLAELIGRFWIKHPLTTISLDTKLSTNEILRRVRNFELDAGICYPQQNATDVRATELYRERAVMIATTDMLGGRPEEMTWTQAAAFPMVALDSTMRARAIMDEAFSQVGAEPNIAVETDSVASLHALIRTGTWASIVPDRWQLDAVTHKDAHAVRLTDPVVETSMLLVHNNTVRVSPLIKALDGVARELTGRLRLSQHPPATRQGLCAGRRECL